MKENSVTVLRAFLSGFGAACLLLAGGAVTEGLVTGGSANEASADDLTAIEKLHRADIAATLAADPSQLATLWDDNAVRLEPGGPAEVGKAVIVANDKKQRQENPGVKVLAYKPDFRDLQVAGEWAIEWGYFDTSFRESAQGEAKSFHGKFLRVMKRQPDGSWKFSRLMWNPAQ
jgi:ketosteroid isomerase-like protein